MSQRRGMFCLTVAVAVVIALYLLMPAGIIRLAIAALVGAFAMYVTDHGTH